MSRFSVDTDTTLHFTCDEDENTSPHCFKWYKQIKLERELARLRLVSFGIANDMGVAILRGESTKGACPRIGNLP